MLEKKANMNVMYVIAFDCDFTNSLVKQTQKSLIKNYTDFQFLQLLISLNFVLLLVNSLFCFLNKLEKKKTDVVLYQDG